MCKPLDWNGPRLRKAPHSRVKMQCTGSMLNVACYGGAQVDILFCYFGIRKFATHWVSLGFFCMLVPLSTFTPEVQRPRNEAPLAFPRLPGAWQRSRIASPMLQATSSDASRCHQSHHVYVQQRNPSKGQGHNILRTI